MNKELLNRLFYYREVIRKMKLLGFKRVFSNNLADALNINSVKVRKDFSSLGIKGNYKSGYEVDYLLKKIDEILRKEEFEKVIIVGVGNIGSALLNYNGFGSLGIKIVGGFDIDSAKVNPEKEPPILPIEKMKDFIQTNNIKIGILAVPETAAQRMAEMMIEAGIKGILNFSPIKLKIKDCLINDIHIEVELEKLIYSVKLKEINFSQK